MTDEDAEVLLWPHQPGIEHEGPAQPLLIQIQTGIDAIPTGLTPAGMGRFLGADVVVAHIARPRWGWTWFRLGQGPLIEAAVWLGRIERDLVIAHEVCHVILGPPPMRHDPLTERVCNWGAARILQRAGERLQP